MEYCNTGGRVSVKDCGGVNCPLQVKHPPAVEEHQISFYPLGCGLCRAEKLAEHSQKLGIAQVATEEYFAPKAYAHP